MVKELIGKTYNRKTKVHNLSRLNHMPHQNEGCAIKKKKLLYI